MVRFTSAVVLAFAMTVAAIPAPAPLSPDPAGTKNVGVPLAQFIGGQCLNNENCAGNCCATLGDIGICSGLQAAFQSGKTGCGFGDGGSTPAASPSAAAGTAGSSSAGTGIVTIDPNGAGIQNVGAKNGYQFITGQCTSDADCSAGCCAAPGICSSPNIGKACGFIGTLAQ